MVRLYKALSFSLSLPFVLTIIFSKYFDSRGHSSMVRLYKAFSFSLYLLFSPSSLAKRLYSRGHSSMVRLNSEHHCAGQKL